MTVADCLAYKTPGESNWRSLISDGQAGDTAHEDARRARKDLQEVLLASLQMQHLVVLAGSGCSRSADGPSMNDLWNAAIGTKPSEKATAAAEKVKHDLDSTNIEAFLSNAEAYLQVNTGDKAVRDFVNACKEAILDECSQFLDIGKLGAHQTFLHRLSRRRVRDSRLKVFTTNYDLCFERAAGELGGVALDGFSFSAPRRYDPRYFGYDIIRRARGGDDLGSFLEGVFVLYKLHGSVNWARNDRAVITEKLNPTPDEACLIYPATGKYQQSFLQPHLESIAQYLAVLREPNTCLIVTGFGFNDDHLSEPLMTAVQSNPHLRLIIADPSIDSKGKNGESDNRYWQQLLALGEHGEDIWFVNADFLQFAELIPDLKSLTPAEKLMRSIQNVAEKK